MFEYRRFVATVLLGICVAAPAAIALPQEQDSSALNILNENGMNATRSLSIIGGNDADPWEYPYFAQTAYCGGVLIASEWVLTAAHCKNITEQRNGRMSIGAYQNQGGRIRKCAEYIPHPAYDWEGLIKNDFALCKLHLPIYVDDSKVTLRLNDDDNFPAAGETVVAIGMGVTKEFYDPPVFLKEATMNILSNEACMDLLTTEGLSENELDRFFGKGENICTTSDEDEYKSSCAGDSGGPILRKESLGGDGKSVHVHIGVTSFGDANCDRPPSVYARTSSGIDFVKKTICGDFESQSPFCQEALYCNSDSEEKLEIKIVTDSNPTEISWELSKHESVCDEPLLSVNNYEQPFFTYGSSICLEKGASYKFVINDSFGDGLTNTTGQAGGFYSLTLNGEDIAMGKGYGLQDIVDIDVTPICDNDNDYKFKSKTNGMTCSKIASLGKKKRKEFCNKMDPKNGKKLVSSYCPLSCLEECRNICDNHNGYKFESKTNGMTCSKIASLGRKKRKEFCNKKDPKNGNVLVSSLCPSNCIKKCRKMKREKTRE